MAVVIIDALYSSYKTRKEKQPRAAKKLNLTRRFALVIFSIAAMYFLIVVFSDAFIRQQSVVRDSLSILTASSVGQEALGQKITVGWPIEGNYELMGNNGHAILSIPVSGSNQSGKIYVEAIKRDGIWKIDSLKFSTSKNLERQIVFESRN